MQALIPFVSERVWEANEEEPPPLRERLLVVVCEFAGRLEIGESVPGNDCVQKRARPGERKAASVPNKPSLVPDSLKRYG